MGKHEDDPGWMSIIRLATEAIALLKEIVGLVRGF